MSRLTRVNINFVPKAAAALDRVITLTGDSRTDAINQAIQAYAFLLEQAGEGKQVVLRDTTTGVEERVRFL